MGAAARPKLLVTGAGGQIGRALVEEARRRGYAVSGYARDALDVCDERALAAALHAVRPDWVLNCAAATKVDRCEREPAWAELLNSRVPAALAALCRSAGCGLLHWSTDFVFDGESDAPYSEDAPQAPLSVYGRTKAAGERAVAAAGLDRWLVLRTQWVYGPSGRNFPAAILTKAAESDELRVVSDQIGRPSYAPHLAAAALDLIEQRATGVFHVAGGDVMSWYDFARLILSEAGRRGVAVRAITSDELDLPARRPKRAVLALDKVEALLGRSMPGAAEGIRAWLAAEGRTAPREHMEDV